MAATSSFTSTRFRFRDHTDREGIIALDCGSPAEGLDHPSADSSSVSSDRDDDSELQSMTAQGIQHMCSELLELKTESDEDFQLSIFSNYSAFLRISEEMDGLESELMQLKYQASIQKKLIKDLMERISLKALSVETMESGLDENLCSEASSPSKLDSHTEDISEILDTLLSEHRLDEALSVLEMETRAFQSMQLGENFSPDELMSYNSAISEKKAMIADQLVLVAQNTRVSPPELQQALVGLCKLNNGHLATQLLLNHYHTRIACGAHDLHSSKVFQNELYIRELAKFVFSMISQADRSVAALHGEESSYTSALTEWASQETETFAKFLNKYVRSISDISDGLSMAVQALQYAVSYCSLLETQRVDLRSCLINHVCPCMEQFLIIHVDHYKKVINIFTSTDTWILGRYLMSGIIIRGGLLTVVDEGPQYCFLTDSGRKFVTLFQALAHDGFPLVALQLEGSILRALMDIFTQYIGMLEKALTGDGIQKDESRINLAESLVQGVSIIANALTLGQLFSNMVRSAFEDVYHLNFEIDNYIVFIQDTHARLRAYLFEQVIHKFLSPEGDQRLDVGSYLSLQDDSHICSLVPSIPYQGFYLQIRKLQKFAEDNYIEHDWLIDLLRDLTAAIFAWISSRINALIITKEKLMEQQLADFMQLILDIQFLVETARCGGYLSENLIVASMDIISCIEFSHSSAQVILERHVNAHSWATDAAVIALQKLQELEEESITSEMTSNLEEETNECQSQNSSDLFEDDNLTISSKQSIDPLIMHASEMPSPESKISEVGDVPGERDSLDHSTAVDTFDHQAERDDDRRRISENSLPNDDAEEESTKEPIGTHDHSGEEPFHEKVLDIQDTGKTTAALDDGETHSNTGHSTMLRTVVTDTYLDELIK